MFPNKQHYINRIFGGGSGDGSEGGSGDGSKGGSKGGSGDGSKGGSKGGSGVGDKDDKINDDNDNVKENDVDTDTDTDTETDTDNEPIIEDEYMIPQPLPSSTHIKHYKYPFIDDELDYELSDFEDSGENLSEYLIELFVFRVNTTGYIPFLEYLLYYNQSYGKCILPYIEYKPSKKTLHKQADECMRKLFDTSYLYRGYVFNKETKRCAIVYEKFSYDSMHATEYVEFSNHANKYTWLWACGYDIINTQAYLNIPIDEHVVDLFNERITMLYLKGVTDDGVEAYLEIPSILYTGNNYMQVSFLASHGMRRQSIFSLNGPYYYFSEFLSCMKDACYNTRHQVKDISKDHKFSKGGIIRYAVFVGKMKCVLHNIGSSSNAFPSNTTQSVIKSCEWAREYDTVYTKNNGWCISDFYKQKPLSFHYIDTTGIPDSYDAHFDKYKVL